MSQNCAKKINTEWKSFVEQSQESYADIKMFDGISKVLREGREKINKGYGKKGGDEGMFKMYSQEGTRKSPIKKHAMGREGRKGK